MAAHFAFDPCTSPCADPDVLTFALGHHPIGHILVACRGTRLAQVRLGEGSLQAAESLLQSFLNDQAVSPWERDGAQARLALAALQAHLEAPQRRPLQLAFAAAGTPFQRRVWQALQQIPVGQTRAYGALAASLGLAHGARAVAGACAANPLAIAIPCHRVIGNDGSLRGFAWGMRWKRALLAAEQSLTEKAV